MTAEDVQCVARLPNYALVMLTQLHCLKYTSFITFSVALLQHFCMVDIAIGDRIV